MRSELVTSILEVEDLEGLHRVCAVALRQLLAGQTVHDCGLLIRPNGNGKCILIEARQFENHRLFRPFVLSDELEQAIAASPGEPFLFKLPPDRLVNPADPPAMEPLQKPAHSLIVPLIGGLGADAVLWIAVDPGAQLGPGQAEGLKQLGAAIRRVINRIMRHEELESQNDQMRKLHEMMHRAMIVTDRQTMLGMFMTIMNRQFNMTRIYIALVNPESNVLRGEVETGFSQPLKPRAVPAEEGRNRFVAAMRQGEALLLDSRPHDYLISFLGDETQIEPAERGVLLPLVIGLKPLGIIYADQPRHDGTPLYKPVLDTFARLAAAAMENLILRTHAEHRAETDPLTGLHNRYFLDRVLELEIPRVKRYNTPISLLMIDLCDFKRTNDTYGHPFGDFVLRETAKILQAHVRAHDVVVRYGGDEFVVLMANTNHEQAELVRRRIEGAFIERNHHQTDERMMISISLGLRSADANSIENLIYDADQAMYAQKARQKRVQLIHALLTDNLERVEAADRVVGSLCNMLWRKAPYYPQHARRVAHLALKIGKVLALSADEMETLALAALLHDIGKASLPADILQKSEEHTPAEVEALRHHPELGEQFFQGIEHLEPVRPLIRSHHERYDSELSGPYPSYPDGLAGEWIPLGARILRLAEMADTMLEDRPYRKAPGLEAAEKTLRAESGKAFDPRLVGILLGDPKWHEGLGKPEEIAELIKGE
ncbi:diguanylate cyclase [bacterium]|nr:diguanylate cyclase [bacterium]